MATKREDMKGDVISEPRMTRSRRKRLAEADQTHQKSKGVNVKEESTSEKKNIIESPSSKPKIKKTEKKNLVSSKEKTRAESRRSKSKTKGQVKKIKGEVRGAASAKEKNQIQVKPKKETESTGLSEEMAGFIAKGGKFVGAHTSSAGGLWNAVSDAVAIKGRAFALFLKSQRQWKAKPLEEDVIDKFQTAFQDSGYHPDFILPHGSYLLNCGSPNPETLQKSREALLDEVQRCQRLGLNRYNFHPGSTCGEIPVDRCLDLIGESINSVLDETASVTIVVENMSCQGNTVGGKFEELRGIIDRVKDKSRIGVCLDTCHAFAAVESARSEKELEDNLGFDLSTEDGYNKMMEDFDKVIGFQYLKGVHLNDSKGKVGCHLDRHENIGKGFIGLEGFRRVMNDKRFEQVPMILETPPGADYEKEIKLLYSLVG